tara:strand:- start:823 stop:1446 length:624 start_codon:yes stop_codon:yes gene_type:complete
MSSQKFDPVDWKNWPDWKLREVYGEDKYGENRDAAIYRQNLKTNNFLKGFLGALASPITNTLGMMGVPGMIGAGYGNPMNAEKVSPQPWIIDSSSGKVVANPAVNSVKDYLSSYNAFQDAYNKTSPYAMGSSNKVKKDWLSKTANSPAAQAGFTPEERWALQQKTRDFRGAQKAGTMDEFVKRYPQSQTAKERAIGNRIPTSMDMEF